MFYELLERVKVRITMNTMQTIKKHVEEVLKANKIEIDFKAKNILSKCTSQALLIDVCAMQEKTIEQLTSLMIKKTFFNKEDKQLALAQIVRHIKDNDIRLAKRMSILANKS
jgi:arsenate reductase-like glutaredoxin family protein